MANITDSLRDSVAAEYNRAKHGYAKGWHIIVFFLAVIVAAGLVTMAIQGSPLHRFLTSGGASGTDDYGR